MVRFHRVWSARPLAADDPWNWEVRQFVTQSDIVRYGSARSRSWRPDHIGNRICRERLLRQARFAQAIGDLLGVRGVPEWQSADMIHVGVSRIDFLELAPNPAGLVQMTQMAQR